MSHCYGKRNPREEDEGGEEKEGNADDLYFPDLVYIPIMNKTIGQHFCQFEWRASQSAESSLSQRSRKEDEQEKKRAKDSRPRSVICSVCSGWLGCKLGLIKTCRLALTAC